VSELIYIGGFSGGIDSQAAARFMPNRYGAARVVLVDSDVGGNEHPLTERAHTFQSGSGRAGHDPSGKFAGSAQVKSGDYDIRLGPVVTTVTLGWEPSCSCSAPVAPCAVLDPFNGAGTTGLVALRLGRSYIGIELNPEYVAMSERRIREDAPLFRQKEQP